MKTFLPLKPLEQQMSNTGPKFRFSSKMSFAAAEQKPATSFLDSLRSLRKRSHTWMSQEFSKWLVNWSSADPGRRAQSSKFGSKSKILNPKPPRQSPKFGALGASHQELLAKLGIRWPTYAASCNIQRAHGQKHKHEDRKDWSSLKKEKNLGPKRHVSLCLLFFVIYYICGNPWKAWKNRHSYKCTKTIIPERPAFDCGGLCPCLFIEIGYPVVNKFFRSSMILPMTACVAQPILHRKLFKQRVTTFFNVLQRGLIRPIRGTHAGAFDKKSSIHHHNAATYFKFMSGRPCDAAWVLAARSFFRVRLPFPLSFWSWSSRFLLSWNQNKNWMRLCLKGVSLRIGQLGLRCFEDGAVLVCENGCFSWASFSSPGQDFC